MFSSLLKAVIGAVVLGALAGPAAAAVRVFACEPEWAALSREIGGDLVTVTATATTALQDPHQIQARPSLIASARAADMTVCTGAELEIGWLPQILQQAANRKIAPGGPGAFQAADHVRLLEVPSSVDRSQGDVHALGNPHIQADPRVMLPVGKALSERFAELDPANAALYRSRYDAFAARWNAALTHWQERAAPLHGQPVAVQHRTWVYLESWLGLRRIVALEPKPGVPPSSGYLAQVLAVLGKSPVKAIIRAAYEDGRASDFVGGRAKVPEIVLPYTVGGTPEAKDLYSLYDDTLNRLLKTVRP